jgi:hypothetical protein
LTHTRADFSDVTIGIKGTAGNLLQVVAILYGFFFTGNCSELILSVARLDYIADYGLDYVRIEASFG